MQKKTSLGILHALGWDRARLEASGVWSGIVPAMAAYREALESYTDGLATGDPYASARRFLEEHISDHECE